MTDLGQSLTDTLFSSTGVFRRLCNDCSNSAYQTMYYERRSSYSTNSFSAYNNMVRCWQSSNNRLDAGDFALYGSDADFLARTNAWAFCNYGAPGQEADSLSISL